VLFGFFFLLLLAADSRITTWKNQVKTTSPHQATLDPVPIVLEQQQSAVGLVPLDTFLLECIQSIRDLGGLTLKVITTADMVLDLALAIEKLSGATERFGSDIAVFGTTYESGTDEPASLTCPATPTAGDALIAYDTNKVALEKIHGEAKNCISCSDLSTVFTGKAEAVFALGLDPGDKSGQDGRVVLYKLAADGAVSKLIKGGLFYLGQWGWDKIIKYWTTGEGLRVISDIEAKGFTFVKTVHVEINPGDKIQHRYTNTGVGYSGENDYLLNQEKGIVWNVFTKN